MIKKATAEQRKYYEKILYPLQDRILADEMIRPFYLTGGTALSRYYYRHRYSDDLDLFCDGLKYSKDDFSVFCRRLIYSLEKRFKNVEVMLNGDYYKRFFIKSGQADLKIECVYEAYKNIGGKINKGTFALDSKENICVNKITAITDRKTLKDYVDLFFLLKDMQFERIVKYAEYKMVPLDYENAVIAFKNTIPGLEGEVLLTGSLKERELYEFIKKLVRKMLGYAKKKK